MPYPVEANVDYLLSMWINVQELDGTPVNGIYPNITFSEQLFYCSVLHRSLQILH